MVQRDNNAKEKAEQIISSEIATVSQNPSVIKGNGCAACHVLFTTAEKMQISEQDAADLLSEVLLDNIQLNDHFIELVENVHMKQRMMGTGFVIKNREAKDRYIDSNFKNTLAELQGDASGHGIEIVLRKLILSHVSIALAQNLGIDYHAATEELYYYMRKNDQATHEQLMELIASLLSRSARK